MRNIRKFVPFIFLVLLLSIAAIAQTEKQIAAIRVDVNAINKNAAKYTKQKRNVEGLSLEGTEATYFLSGKGLKKIVAKMYGETYRATAELYYSGEEMIFAFQRLEKYTTHFAANPSPKIARTMETRAYFSGGKAIRVIEDKKVHATTDSEFRAAEEAMNDLSQTLRSALDK